MSYAKARPTIRVCDHCHRQACVYWTERACRAARRGTAGVTTVPADHYFEARRDVAISVGAVLVLVALVVGALAVR